MDFTTEIKGVDGLLAAMAKLPATTNKRAILPAMRKGINIIKKQAIENVRRVVSKERTTGLLAANIISKQFKPRKIGDIRFGVVIRGKVLAKNGQRVGAYGSVLEFGRREAHGNQHGVEAPHPWLRPAIRDRASECITVVTDEVLKNIDKAVEEAAR